MHTQSHSMAVERVCNHIILFIALPSSTARKLGEGMRRVGGGWKERKLRNFKREVEFYVNVVASALAMMLMYNEKIHYFFLW